MSSPCPPFAKADARAAMNAFPVVAIASPLVADILTGKANFCS